MNGPVDADLERRFGGLRRLYGDARYARLRGLRVAVVGVGGVGSWAAEALARCGVAGLTLIDMDHVAESNINRQVQATGATLGMAKIDALADRLRDIHPGCEITRADAFVEAAAWPAMLPAPVDVLIDACDQVRAKLALAAWAIGQGRAIVCCGAAGGKRDPTRIEAADLAQVTHDPLLAALRQRLRRQLGIREASRRLGLRCVYSREAVVLPARASSPHGGAGGESEGGTETCEVAVDGSLNCAGYGSSVMVTAAFGLAAAAQAAELAFGL